ncbi:TLC domain containing protein [Amanita muscaria]
MLTSSSRPFGSVSPRSPTFQPIKHVPRAFWLRWAIDPSAAFKLLLVPVVMYVNWELLTPAVVSPALPNPFAPFFLLSGRIPTTSNEEPRYAKSYYDVLFIIYYVIFWSMIRQWLTLKLSRPLARYFRIRKEAKINRFGEQAYAFLYFLAFSAWGYRVTTQLPTYWYNTEFFWRDYPHWDMKPELKRYYLMQSSYWCQQLLVLLLGLEKPRKDYLELVAHHIVTLWLVGWSYLTNLTLIGNAVFVSMDIPDTFLAFSKLLNYMQWDIAKLYAFAFFMCVWTYFRHYLNLRILWSVWSEFRLIPEHTKQWKINDGVWLPQWMRYQVFAPLVLLQLLNLFWFYLMWRILLRALVTSQVDDDRSDDDDDKDE